jgi:hypothetical protein
MSKIRLTSIDFLKGLSMIIVIYVHTSFWLTGFDNQWFHGICWVFLDVNGSSAYITLTSLGITFSVLSQKNSPKPNSKSPVISILKKALVLFIIGTPFVANYFEPSPFGFFDPRYVIRLHIFQAIAVCQFVAYFALKIKPVYRIALVVAIIAAQNIFYPMMLGVLAPIGVFPKVFPFEALNNGFAWLYMFTFRADVDIGILPELILPLMGTIVGEYIYKNLIVKTQKNNTLIDSVKNSISQVNATSLQDRSKNNNISELDSKTRENIIKQVNVIIYIGIIFTLYGILSGLTPIAEYRGFDVLNMINRGGPFHFEGLCTFLFRGTISNLLYNFGVIMTAVGVGLKYIDLKRAFFKPVQLDTKTKGQKFVDNIAVLGQYSLTVYVMHHMLSILSGIAIPSILLIQLIDITYILVNVYCIIKYVRRFKGKYTFEYFVQQLTK